MVAAEDEQGRVPAVHHPPGRGGCRLSGCHGAGGGGAGYHPAGGFSQQLCGGGQSHHLLHHGGRYRLCLCVDTQLREVECGRMDEYPCGSRPVQEDEPACGRIADSGGGRFRQHVVDAACRGERRAQPARTGVVRPPTLHPTADYPRDGQTQDTRGAARGDSRYHRRGTPLGVRYRPESVADVAYAARLPHAQRQPARQYGAAGGYPLHQRARDSRTDSLVRPRHGGDCPPQGHRHYRAPLPRCGQVRGVLHGRRRCRYLARPLVSYSEYGDGAGQQHRGIWQQSGAGVGESPCATAARRAFPPHHRPAEGGGRLRQIVYARHRAVYHRGDSRDAGAFPATHRTGSLHGRTGLHRHRHRTDVPDGYRTQYRNPCRPHRGIGYDCGRLRDSHRRLYRPARPRTQPLVFGGGQHRATLCADGTCHLLHIRYVLPHDQDHHGSAGRLCATLPVGNPLCPDRQYLLCHVGNALYGYTLYPPPQARRTGVVRAQAEPLLYRSAKRLQATADCLFPSPVGGIYRACSVPCRGRLPHGGATQPATATQGGARVLCRRDTPARRLIGGANRTGGGLAGAADAYRQAYHLYHLVCRAGKSAVPRHLHAADGEAELCAVYRQYHVHQGDGGDIEGIHTPLRELFSQCLRAVQATGLPGGEEPARGALQGR